MMHRTLARAVVVVFFLLTNLLPMAQPAAVRARAAHAGECISDDSIAN